jgi:hypothetical protein
MMSEVRSWRKPSRFAGQIDDAIAPLLYLSRSRSISDLISCIDVSTEELCGAEAAAWLTALKNRLLQHARDTMSCPPDGTYGFDLSLPV